MSSVWKVQIYQGPQTDVMKCAFSSVPRDTRFLADTIKAMTSTGKWLNATYMRLLRCGYICHEFKNLKAKHLILNFFLYTQYMSDTEEKEDSENDSECLNWIR